MKLSSILSPALKIGGTVILLYLVFRTVEIAKIKQDLARIETGWLALLVLIILIGQLFCAQRWRLFAASLGMEGSYGFFVRMYFVGMLFNVGLPSLVGGDVVKAYMITRKTRSRFYRGIASVLQDRAAGLMSLLAYGSIATALHPMSWRGIPVWLAYLMVWSGIIAVLAIAWKGTRLYDPLLVEGSTSPFQKLLRYLRDFHAALVAMRIEPRAVAQITLLSFLNSALVLWAFQQVSVGAGHPVPIVAFSALFPLIAVITMAPISLGGVGVREWSYVHALSLVQVPADVALTIALVTSALHIVVDLAGLLFLPTIPSQLRSPVSDAT